MICQKFVIFISHKRSRVWTRYFTRSCVIISSACVIFLVNLDDFFIVVCTGFHSRLVSIAYVAIQECELTSCKPKSFFGIRLECCNYWSRYLVVQVKQLTVLFPCHFSLWSYVLLPICALKVQQYFFSDEIVFSQDVLSPKIMNS